MSQPPLVLASSSPRRRDLLATLGLTFTVEAPEVDEAQHDGEEPGPFVERVARAKSRAVHRAGIVCLGADTTVVLDGGVLGKPTSPAAASAMLAALRGRDHLVHTGIALTTDTDTWSGVVTTTVTMANFDDRLIDWYVSTGEPMDKAGSYALQGIGGVLVDHVVGDPFNVIGLPLGSLRDLFEVAGLDLLGYRAS